MLKTGFYQFRPLFGKPDINCRKMVHALEKMDADLVVLPELALSGYYFANKEEALTYSEDPQRSKRLDALATVAAKKDMYLVVGFAERVGDKCYNSSALIGPNGIEHIYRKIHLFNEEKFCFDPGDIPFKVNMVKGARIGMIVCFDWAFPESIRTLALQGAQVICQPANLVLTYCQQTMLARSIENRVFIITCNRYGEDKRPQGSLKFTGRSQVVAPGGELLYRAQSQRDASFVIEIDPGLADNKMITKHNHLLDERRTEFYDC